MVTALRERNPEKEKVLLMISIDKLGVKEKKFAVPFIEKTSEYERSCGEGGLRLVENK